MKNAVPAALLALLLVCSLPAVALVAADSSGERAPSTDDGERAVTQSEATYDLTSVTVDDPSMRGVVTADDTTNRLVLEGDVRSEHVGSSPNFGATLAAEDDALRLDQERFAVDDVMAEGTTSQRQAAIEAAYDRIQERTAELEEREREAVRQHANGQLSDGELLTVLLRNAENAAALDDALDQLESDADRTLGVSIDADADRTLLDQYRGPVRSQLDAAGAGGTNDVLLETSTSGLSLAAVGGGEYVRETVRFDNRDLDRTAQIENLTTAGEYAETYYPWAANEQPVGVGLGMVTIRDESPVNQYRVDLKTVQGDVEIALDTGTAGVYREVQSLSVDDLPATPEGETWTNDTLELSLNRTAVNGPIEVVATDGETGEPVDATVAVDDRELGETGADGSLWILPPAGEFELTAQAEGETVTATVPGWEHTLEG